MLHTFDRLNSTSRLRIGMGTIVAVSADAYTAQCASSGLETAYAAIDQVERLMHPTRRGSDLLAIHLAVRGRALAVHAWTWEVLELSQRLNRLSNGAFDPCLPDSSGRIADLELAPPCSVIPRLPLRIDLGGIAKGFAVDRALAAMRAHGCQGGLVNAGGDLAVFGDSNHAVVVRNQLGAEMIVELNNAALASSEVGNSAAPAEHRGYYHGVSRREITAGRICVVAPTAAVADALTKCLLIAPGETSAALLAAFDARIAAGGFDP